MDKTETNDLLEECMLYFKARPVYKKLFLKMRDKYAGLGHFGGTAMLTSLSREEKSQLGGFFQRDYTSNKTITISADLMKKCLESSKFAGLTWELILETYFGEPLQVKKEIELAESKRRIDMTYADMFSKVKGLFMESDVSDISEHLAFQFNITGEAEGIFYAEVKDGVLAVEPYEYFDRDAIFICSAETLFKLAEGRLDPSLAFTTGKLKVEGNIDKALRLKQIIDSKKA